MAHNLPILKTQLSPFLGIDVFPQEQNWKDPNGLLCQHEAAHTEIQSEACEYHSPNPQVVGTQGGVFMYKLHTSPNVP